MSESTSKSSSVDDQMIMTEDSDSYIDMENSQAMSGNEGEQPAGRELIARYFYQLKYGCGNSDCTNGDCASSGNVPLSSDGDLMARAVQLLEHHAEICNNIPIHSGMMNTSGVAVRDVSITVNRNEPDDLEEAPIASCAFPDMPDFGGYSPNMKSCDDGDENEAENSLNMANAMGFEYLNEMILNEMIDGWLQCKDETLFLALNVVLPSVEKLSHSFYSDIVQNQNPSELPKVSSENRFENNRNAVKLHCNDDENVEREIDASHFQSTTDRSILSATHLCNLDFDGLRRIKVRLYELNGSNIFVTISTNISEMCKSVLTGRLHDWDQVMHCLLIGFEFVVTGGNADGTLHAFDYTEAILPNLCLATSAMPVRLQARLARIWSHYYKNELHKLVMSCHQLLSSYVQMDNDEMEDNPEVVAVVRVLKIAFYANILDGEIDEYTVPDAVEVTASCNDVDFESNDGDFCSALYRADIMEDTEETLESVIGVSLLSCRKPLIPFEEFYNQPFSNSIQLDRYTPPYRSLLMDRFTGEHLFYMLYGFLLTAPAKALALHYDNRFRQEEDFSPSRLHFRLRRGHTVTDALRVVELVAKNNPHNLKKSLNVEFVGEPAIDDGGVAKEFFQLIIDEIFNPAFGLFKEDEETKLLWFNLKPLADDHQYRLVGMLVGIAIYNNITLGLHFPLVMHRKLSGARGTFYDMEDFDPFIYGSLKSVLDYEGDDIESEFDLTFRISYSISSSERVDHDLIPGGDDIIVGQHNKHEFVRLYSDFLLNKVVEKKFSAFKKGFDLVLTGSPFNNLFRPEEMNLLFCGCSDLDFNELELVAEYEGGYSKDTEVIKNFWSIVHSLSDEHKRKLLEFVTATTHVGIGGFGTLNFVINRNGSDSNRLPRSHTCFNVLLLPEYSSKEKMEDRLLKAITYSKGFGML